MKQINKSKSKIPKVTQREMAEFVQERNRECMGAAAHADRRLLLALSVLSLANLAVFAPGFNFFPDNLSHRLGICISAVNAGAFGLMLGEVFGNPIRRRLNSYFFGNRDRKTPKSGNCEK
jgi:hypothetical protein